MIHLHVANINFNSIKVNKPPYVASCEADTLSDNPLSEQSGCLYAHVSYMYVYSGEGRTIAGTVAKRKHINE